MTRKDKELGPLGVMGKGVLLPLNQAPRGDNRNACQAELTVVHILRAIFLGCLC